MPYLSSFSKFARSFLVPQISLILSPLSKPKPPLSQQWDTNPSLTPQRGRPLSRRAISFPASISYYFIVTMSRQFWDMQEFREYFGLRKGSSLWFTPLELVPKLTMSLYKVLLNYRGNCSSTILVANFGSNMQHRSARKLYFWTLQDLYYGKKKLN